MGCWSDAVVNETTQVVHLDLPKAPTASDALELTLHFGLVTGETYQDLKTRHK